MKVLSIGINNQYVTFFESDAKDFYRIKNVEFRTKKEHLREKLFFYFNLKKSAAESHRLLVKAYGMLYKTTCKN